MKKNIYVLYHKHDTSYTWEKSIFDTKIIGCFDSKKQVNQTINVYKKLVGFKDYPNGFKICCKKIKYIPSDKIVFKIDCSIFLYDDVEIIEDFGVFPTRKDAEKIITDNIKRDSKRYKADCFFIDKYKLNACYWKEGFTTGE